MIEEVFYLFWRFLLSVYIRVLSSSDKYSFKYK